MTNRLFKTLLITALTFYFLFSVIANIPARLLAAFVHDQVPVVWLNSVEGTMWKGSAAAAQIDVKPSAISLGRVTWELSPMSLLGLNPCVKFRSSQKGQNISGTLCQSIGGRSSVEDVKVDGPIAIINSLAGTQLKGTASLEVPSAEFTRTEVKRLNASLNWHNGRVLAFEEWLVVGSVVANLKENDRGGIKAELFNMKAPLGLDIRADWTAAEGWTAEGTAKPGQGTPEKIVNTLKMWGDEVEPGTYKLVWK